MDWFPGIIEDFFTLFQDFQHLAKMKSLLLYFCFFFLWFPSNCKVFNRYDKSILKFSDKGELLQVEYAKKSGLLGETILCGISEKGQEIVVCIPTSKKNHILLDRKSIDKVTRIDENVFFAFSGLGGDGRAVIEKLRDHCIDKATTYQAPVELRTLSSFLGLHQHSCTLYEERRPYGIQSLLLGFSREKEVMEVYLCEPSGEFWSLNAASIGKSSQSYLEKMEKDWNPSWGSVDIAKYFDKITNDYDGGSEDEDSDTKNYKEFYLIKYNGKECYHRYFSSVSELEASSLPQIQ
jgi:20S proteasome alpha/beta subunit